MSRNNQITKPAKKINKIEENFIKKGEKIYNKINLENKNYYFDPNHKLKIDIFKNDFLENNKFKSIGFFRQSPAHYMLLLTILERFCNGTPIAFEDIMKGWPNHLGSRSTVFKILKEAVDAKFLTKSMNFEDGREQIYSPSINFIKQSNLWLNTFKFY
tara:strand:+ start:2847 stop:3320 length:474 start_codon:yes stop_codon:yes gene_type:complete